MYTELYNNRAKSKIQAVIRQDVVETTPLDGLHWPLNHTARARTKQPKAALSTKISAAFDGEQDRSSTEWGGNSKHSSETAFSSLRLLHSALDLLTKH